MKNNFGGYYRNNDDDDDDIFGNDPFLDKRAKFRASMKEALLVGMETPLVGLDEKSKETNKGLKLLRAFGWNDSSNGLGKHEQGLKEPLKIELGTAFTDANYKQGLGMVKQEPMISQKRKNEINEEIKEGEFVKSKDAFRKCISENRNQIQIEKDLKECENVLSELDERNGASESSLQFFSETKTERLRECLDCLREKYFYCIYCGCQYDSDADLSNNCPGLNSDEH